MNAIGIDGCRRGWFFVQLTGSGRYHIGIAEQLEALRVAITASELTLIDIPIGLRSAGAEERRCDREARKLLGPRASSVFVAPCRQALGCEDYASGSSTNRAVTGRRLSRQSWAITPKIAEVDTFIRMLSERRKLREMHPELCFRALNDSQPMGHNKKKAAGHAERLAVLSRWLPQVPKIVEQARARWPRKDLAIDDILDALVGAVTAARPGALESLPAVPEKDDKGLSMEIVYARGTV
ncbi:DUF429 domain-containing protein [Thiohalomonas denitrificans]|uniref:DUF429 domain-containing protein n=1 Tax=Thiohalomonas denitrificans TaxID=415747 RepID=UPI0026F002AA|nr:DUF429 domain-containing protein [Thiohalomonas denitrificans]